MINEVLPIDGWKACEIDFNIKRDEVIKVYSAAQFGGFDGEGA